MRHVTQSLFLLLILSIFLPGCGLFSSAPTPNNAVLIESNAANEETAVNPSPTIIPSPTVDPTMIQTPLATAVPAPAPYCSDGIPSSENPTAPEYKLQIIQAYPHDANAFTQGLLYFNGQLYESTGLRGQSTIRQVDLESGQVQKQVGIDPTQFGEGTAVYDNKLYQLTWQAGQGHIYDVNSLEQIGAFDYMGQGWGLTSNGACLIMSNGSSQITYRDPETFEILGTILVQDAGQEIHQLNELEYINGEIWANIWKSPFIVRIDPQTGHVLGWIDGSLLIETVQPRNNDAVLNGIAFDAENGRLFLTGKLWPTLFEVQLIQN